MDGDRAFTQMRRMAGAAPRSVLAAAGAIGCVLTSGPGAAQSGLAGLECMIEPHSVVDVSTREEGVLATVAVRRGDTVEAGQVVAMLESSLESLAVELARARAQMTSEIEARRTQLEFVLRQQKRVQELYQDNLVPSSELDKADTDVRLAQTELRIAEDNHRVRQIEHERAIQQLDLRSIRSPVDGVVVDVHIVPGESVEDRAREIMTIAEVDPLNVEVVLPADLFGSIAVGSMAVVTPQMRDAAPRTTAVAVVDRTIDAASETFGVQLQLDNADHSLPGGIRCLIDFL